MGMLPGLKKVLDSLDGARKTVVAEALQKHAHERDRVMRIIEEAVISQIVEDGTGETTKDMIRYGDFDQSIYHAVLDATTIEERTKAAACFIDYSSNVPVSTAVAQGTARMVDLMVREKALFFLEVLCRELAVGEAQRRIRSEGGAS